ncbi:MAG: hypothetical protein ACOYMB_02995 [Patescibacteria group bacterium]
MAVKFNVTGEQYFSIDGQILKIKRQLRLKSGSSIDPELVKLALQDIVEGKFHHESKIVSVPSITRLIESGVMIEACDGKTYISEAKNTFKSGIDGDFKNWSLNNKGNATKETLVDIHEIVEDAKFSQIFPSLNSNLDKLVMTQNQIIRFCEKHPTLLRQEGYATFFLIKENNEYFVVRVIVYSGGLGADVRRLEYGIVWDGEYRHRLVVPQLVA